MPTSDPGLRRVTVHAGAQAVDLTLPAAVPVATLIPSIVDILGDRGASPATAARYQLSALGAPALPNATTLAQCGIRDGAVLVLHKSSAQPPTPRCDDVAEAVAAALDTTARPQCQRTTRLSGALAASCITAGGGLMLVRNALGTNVTRYSDATAGVVAAAGLAALLFAVIACRTYRDPIAGLTLSVIATIFGAVAGLLAVPGVPGVHSVLVAAMAAAATSVLAMRITGCGGITLTAVACCAVVVAAATLVGAITAAPVPAIGSLATLASFGLLEVSARMAVLLAGLSPRLPPALNPDDADALPNGSADHPSEPCRCLVDEPAGGLRGLGDHRCHRNRRRNPRHPQVQHGRYRVGRRHRCAAAATSTFSRHQKVTGVCHLWNHHRCNGIYRRRGSGSGTRAVDCRADRHAGRRGNVFGLRRSRVVALARHVPHHRIAGVSGADRNGSIDRLAMRRLQRRSPPRPDMDMTTSRTLRLLVVSALATLSGLGTPVAHAVSPPPIDERWLPESALPAPPRPTVQREVCTEVTAESGRAFGRAERSAQLADLDQVWRLARGAGQRVAVIDTGVARHRRLPKVVAGGDYVFTGDGTADCDAHGTLVAGIIAAAPDAQSDNFSGVAPDVTLISIRQSSSKFAPVGDPSSTGVGDVDTMAKAVRTAADLGASVINISSIACVPAAAAPDDRALGAALAYAVDVKNAVIVAAAGNTGGAAQCPPQAPGVTRDSVTVAVSPAWYDDYVLTVGSVNAQGEPSAFTLAGPWVDVAATGEAVTSLSPFGDGTVNRLGGQHGSIPISGTSYAAPVVSGLAALIRARFPTLTARQVMQRIESTAHHPPAGWDPLVGNGTVDALAAVSSDSIPQAGTATSDPAPVAVPVPRRSTPGPSDRRALHTAFAGAAICLLALMATLATASRRLRPGRNGIAGD